MQNRLLVTAGLEVHSYGMRTMTESELRDSLTTNISVLGDDLTLLKKEQFIPSDLGTRSFIDLYAQDASGHHVLIELKRSDAASREALHEIQKYVEGVKRHFGANENEIRVILASTTWRELLLPFSRFASETSLTVTALELFTDNNGDLQSRPAPTVPIAAGRLISPWHELLWYSSTKALDSGMRSIQQSYSAKGIDDYVVAILKPPSPTTSKHQLGMRSVLGTITGQQVTNSDLPKYSFAVFVATQMLSEKQLLQILKKDEESHAEVLEILADEEEEERLHTLHQAVASLDPRPNCDHYEIGYAAKLIEFMNVQRFQVYRVDRFGMFQRNKLLDDETIISEMLGHSGTTGQIFKRTVDMNNRGHVETAKSEIQSCLAGNPIWRTHILGELNQIQREHPNAQAEISIYNPEAGLYTVYYATTKSDGHLYVPNYSIIVKNPAPTRMYYGAIEPQHKGLSFQSLFEKYFSSELTALLLPLSWGGRDSRDTAIFEDMGALYRSFRCDIHGDRREFYSYRNDDWRSCDQANTFVLWQNFLDMNASTVSELVGKISPHDHGTYFSNDDSDDNSVRTSNITSYEVTLREIQSNDVSGFQSFVSSLLADSSTCRSNQGKMELSVSGFHLDPRELWEIKEVTQWFKSVDKEVPWFFLCNTTAPATGLRTYVACLCAVDGPSQVKQNGRTLVEFDKLKLNRLVNQNFRTLNQVTDQIEMSIEENKRITFAAMSAIGIVPINDS